MTQARYFSTNDGEIVPLESICYIYRDPARRWAYEHKYAPSSTGRTIRDGAMIAVGAAADGRRFEADRVIYRKTNPSNHTCDARCQSARGNSCECSCGGKYHGANR